METVVTHSLFLVEVYLVAVDNEMASQSLFRVFFYLNSQ